MRSTILVAVCFLTLGISAYLGAKPEGESITVQLRLIDGETGGKLAGIIRIFPKSSDKPLSLRSLFDRLRGLDKSDAVAGWYVLPAAGAEISLPRAGVRIEALSGLETELLRQDFDPGRDPPSEITLKLRFIFRPEKDHLAAGNTHLHLRGMPLKDADEYLRQIPAADGLKVMFISYLERHKDDESYITNRYPVGDLKQFAATGVLFNNGEEHRHNFQAFGQGYGHVMFLDLKELVKPVSLGPGITGAGDDDRQLRPGIEEAHRQGGTVIWCHNTNGFESVPSALGNRLDAFNVFDGSRTGKYEDNYYRYLNVGLQLPISTGTDWFIYDFARVYARVTDKLSIKSWLEALKAGRTVVTNGPLLTLKVDGREIGDTIELKSPKTVRVAATGLGRHNFQRLQLIHNGNVIATQTAGGRDGSYTARLEREMRLDGPGWFAVRIDSQTKNEFDKQLYAHSSPIYVRYAGRSLFDVDAARALLKQLEEARAEIKSRGKFSSPQAAYKVLAYYTETAKELTERINARADIKKGPE